MSDLFPDWLQSSDRLRLLTEELRYLGPEKWILTSLDFLADELEEAEFAAHEARGRRQGEISSTQ